MSSTISFTCKDTDDGGYVKKKYLPEEGRWAGTCPEVNGDLSGPSMQTCFRRLVWSFVSITKVSRKSEKT